MSNGEGSDDARHAPGGNARGTLSKRNAHAYPHDLARAVQRRWPEVNAGTDVRTTLPEPAVLEEALSVRYQASLLREEGRPVTFRVAFATPDVFAAPAGPPAGLHRLVLTELRPLDQHELRRLVLATVRGAQHGGMLIVMPERRTSEALSNGRYIRLKYAFLDEEPRRRLSTLTAGIKDELAAVQGPPPEGPALGWDEYQTSDARQLTGLDDMLFEAAHLIADLTHVDGAVVMTGALDLLGFGGEIAGDLPEVQRVARARNLAGTDREWVRTDRVGTRHRSAYRLCQVVRDALVLVVSQDGGLHFVRWHDDAVTYWEQVATAPWEV
jgi:hypothetical protein